MSGEERDSVPTGIEALPSVATASTEGDAPSATVAPEPPATPTIPSTPGLSSKLIIGLAVVDFHHHVGPQLEYTFPKELMEDEDFSSTLPFYALPDGSHLSDEDFCYFHLFCPKTLPGSTIFGMSCNRQIAAASLTKKGVEVTRSTVQKAVVVLAKQPVFGPIREKLGIVTRAYFAQCDLTDTVILTEFLSTLETGLRQGLGQSLKEVTMAAGGEKEANPLVTAGEEKIEDSDATMSMGTSLRQLVFQWRFKTLQLVKLLLLQRRVMFFGYPIERLCTYQYSLISLLPGLLMHLEDCGSATLKSSQAKRPKVDSVKTSEKQSLLKYMGYPLPVFGDDAFFQPYLPLQQIDSLKAGSWLVGTSNGVFRSQKDCAIDVIVDLENSNIEFLESNAALKLQNIVALTAEDRKWMDEIVSMVLETWDPNNPSRPTTLQFKGSDDYLRMKFQSYISSMLSAIKASEDKTKTAGCLEDTSTLASFGMDFINTFKLTQAYVSWNDWTDDHLYNIIPASHPCEGMTSVIEDGLHDLKLDENLTPTRDAIGKGLTAGQAALSAGGANLYRFASAARNDIGKQLAALNTTRYPSASNATSSSVPEQPSTSNRVPSFQLPPNLHQSANDAAQAASAAAASAATQARAALGNFGSFLSAKRSEWSGRSLSPSSTSASPSSANSSSFATPPITTATPLAEPTAPLKIGTASPPPRKPSED
ncbi:hypothetical protein K437DRAFT_290257 [Tilletiaria anomala UBC 951]|uniref:UDENN domain-containing protein n=1 Tax=Tilletiaria anomala (strain ATCC 24038 / CBS 436.72 / UBC 951) TaxID=1037660 RepID=A0A066WI83_TILAU|nr:uncharacterized protein K437DRAFT_290257 [Tilletiaria anomala UBC 951]KDN50370.1 hypothetical protein K437DRAFT_290257 [Tilletiaria anomala UBC 951]